jgi:hypothetical protein
MSGNVQLPLSAMADRKAWWSAHRRQYNIVLLTSAPISAALLFAVWAVFEDRLPCLEINGFSIVFGIILFVLGFGLANIFYFFGPLAEKIIRPPNAIAFRRWVYGIGLVFSLLLIFWPPIINLSAAILRLPCIDKFGTRMTSAPGFRFSEIRVTHFAAGVGCAKSLG